LELATTLARDKYVGLHLRTKENLLSISKAPLHIVCTPEKLFLVVPDTQIAPQPQGLLNEIVRASPLIPVLGIAVGLGVAAARIVNRSSEIQSNIETSEPMLISRVKSGSVLAIDRTKIICTRYLVGGSLVFLEKPTATYRLDCQVEHGDKFYEGCITFSDINSPSGQSKWASEAITALGLGFQTTKYPGIKGMYAASAAIKDEYPYHADTQ
jgi:hypothetical protein